MANMLGVSQKMLQKVQCSTHLGKTIYTFGYLTLSSKFDILVLKLPFETLLLYDGFGILYYIIALLNMNA
jgi:hypothetical protein